MRCKLCEAEMLPLYAYPHSIPEVIPFRAAVDEYAYSVGSSDLYHTSWKNVTLYICPKCGSVFGEVEKND